jgi:uncharacterized SAM-binding protein YcdF (DUF218 family)
MQVTLIRDFGITPRWVENKSGDTFENARFSSRILHADRIQRVILVTSSAHEWRAAHEFMSAGLEVIPAPVGTLTPLPRSTVNFVPSERGLDHSRAAIYELVGDPVRRLFAALHLRRQQPSS